MLVQQVLDAVDAETVTFEVGEEHVSVTSLGLTQPGFQHGECGSGNRSTTLLTALFLGHTDDQGFDFLLRRRATGTPTRTAVILVCDELPVPPQQGLWRNNRCQVRQQLSSDQPGLRCQAATLVLSGANSLVAELRVKHSVLFTQVVDCVLLLLIYPSSDSND